MQRMREALSRKARAASTVEGRRRDAAPEPRPRRGRLEATTTPARSGSPPLGGWRSAIRRPFAHLGQQPVAAERTPSDAQKRVLSQRSRYESKMPREHLYPLDLPGHPEGLEPEPFAVELNIVAHPNRAHDERALVSESALAKLKWEALGEVEKASGERLQSCTMSHAASVTRGSIWSERR